jgi:cycloeucalenol cycloisomerase
MAYKLGSAFYGIYFLVSFPAFLEFDREIDSLEKGARKVSVWDTVVESCGYGMIILCLLDFVRLCTGIPLIVGK